MIKKIFKFFLYSLLIISLSSIVLAQRQTGSLMGKVTDEEGAPLPGASVTLSGPAMIGKLTYSTTRGGDFRFPAVPPGSNYMITVEMPGFQTVRRGGIIVPVGKTIALMIKSQPATIKE